MFEVPPLLVSGLSAAVETFRVVVEMMVCSAIAWLSTLLGLSTIACVTLGMSAGEVRNWLGTPRLVSGKETGECGGAIENGVMSTDVIGGALLITGRVLPCATSVVPCGMLAILATVAGSCGLSVGGVLTQSPDSIWMPACFPFGPSTFASWICCR
jgi:hypothetical protein